MAQLRLSKLMSERGICSRREADRFIERGWVKVNGVVVNELGTKVDKNVDIRLTEKALTQQGQQVTVLINKPIGIVSGQAEKGYRPAIHLVTLANFEGEGRIDQGWLRASTKSLAPAGRLDIDSTGLLVLTQNGKIAKQLIGENSNIEKEYLVRVEGQVTNEVLTKLCHGLKLDGRALKPAKVTQLNKDQLKFILKEGRKRQIRRMCEMVGLKVTGLKRVRIGKVRLGKLPPGRWRYLGENERF